MGWGRRSPPPPAPTAMLTAFFRQPELRALNKVGGRHAAARGRQNRRGVSGEGQLTPEESYGGAAELTLQSRRATLSLVPRVSQGDEGQPGAGHQEHCAPGHKIVTVARKGGTLHFLKSNQRPQRELMPFPGPALCPLSWPQIPSEAGWPGSKPPPGVCLTGLSTPGSLLDSQAPPAPPCSRGMFLPLRLDFYAPLSASSSTFFFIP